MILLSCDYLIVIISVFCFSSADHMFKYLLALSCIVNQYPATGSCLNYIILEFSLLKNHFVSLKKEDMHSVCSIQIFIYSTLYKLPITIMCDAEGFPRTHTKKTSHLKQLKIIFLFCDNLIAITFFFYPCETYA